MESSYFALPGEFYTWCLLILVVLLISVLVVWPAVWSKDRARRRAAFRVLDRILTFFRSPRPGIADPRAAVRERLPRAGGRQRAAMRPRGRHHRRRPLPAMAPARARISTGHRGLMRCS
jgi:hypothetical protein